MPMHWNYLTELKINEKEKKDDSNGTRLEQLCEIIAKQEILRLVLILFMSREGDN